MPSTKLMWWKFKQHRIAVWCGVFLGILYATIFISEFLAPYNIQNRHVDHIYSPPQEVHFFHDGEFVGPFVYRQKYTLNMETLKREYSKDTTKPDKIRFFCTGDTYYWWGLVEMETHLFCPARDGELFIWASPNQLHRSMRIFLGINAPVFISNEIVWLALERSMTGSVTTIRKLYHTKWRICHVITSAPLGQWILLVCVYSCHAN